MGRAAELALRRERSTCWACASKGRAAATLTRAMAKSRHLTFYSRASRHLSYQTCSRMPSLSLALLLGRLIALLLSHDDGPLRIRQYE